MTYAQTYNATDMAPVVVDLIVSVVALAVGFATLIGLILLYNWIKGKKTKIRLWRKVWLVVL